MPDDPDPPRKLYQLKPTSFERLNPEPAPPAGDASPRAAPEATAAGAIDVRDLARQASRHTPLLGVNQPANRPNEVHELLRRNLDQANAAGLNDLAPRPKKRSRRLRDYWSLMIVVNAFFVFWAFGPFSNPISLIYGCAGCVLFSTGFTWVMFGVMDDY